MSIASVKQDILENCKDPEYREAFVSENVYTSVSAQIRVLREQRGWSQKRLGRKAGMAQERISILEDPNAATKPTIATLLRLATAFNVGLDLRFVPFSTVLDRAVHTGDTELEVPSFDEELPTLEQQLAAGSQGTAANIGQSAIMQAQVPSRTSGGVMHTDSLVRQPGETGAAARFHFGLGQTSAGTTLPKIPPRFEVQTIGQEIVAWR